MIHRILIATAIVAIPAPQRAAQAAATIQIAVEDAADPWSRTDGAGFANDVVRAAFRAVNVDVKLIVVPYARCKNMAFEGTVPACFSMSPEPGLSQSVTLSTHALFTLNTELVQNPEHPLAAGRLRDLPRGTVIGAVIGYEYPPDVAEARVAGKVVFDESPSESILLRKLAAKRLDGALVNVNESKPLEYVEALAGVSTKLQVAGHVGSESAYVGFSRRNPRGIEVRRAFEDGMNRIAQNGELRRIVRRWEDSSRVAIAALGLARRGRP